MQSNFSPLAQLIALAALMKGLVTPLALQMLRGPRKSSPQYFYRGVEYIGRPYELELDRERGVLYLHNLATGHTVLRICRIPEEVFDDFARGTASISLVHTLPRGPYRVPGGGRVKRAPVFISVDPGYSGFFIENEAGVILIEVLSVPERLVKLLEQGRFVDLTLGYTGRVEGGG